MNGIAVMAAAETPSAMEGITTALTTGITTIASNATDAIAKILPVALPVMGAIVVVTIGIKVFKKFSKG